MQLKWGWEMCRVKELLADNQVWWVLQGWIHGDLVEEVKVNDTHGNGKADEA